MSSLFQSSSQQGNSNRRGRGRNVRAAERERLLRDEGNVGEEREAEEDGVSERFRIEKNMGRTFA